ncbi:DUF599 domain-containing protein [Segnochrobactrum spirostomi]|nr:DUF599 family protein [Segnochrobactrum spirostomi]
MSAVTRLDLMALFWFVLASGGFAFLVDHSPLKVRSLSHAMQRQRFAWMEMMARREVRIVDTAIMSGLQNGTAFFASTSVLAIGGAFALLNSTDRMIAIFADLAVPIGATRVLWELKGLGLVLIYAYAFFKFGWSYRLFNYTSILLGAVPPPDEVDTAEGRRALARVSEMAVNAGMHFNLGLRAFFLSIGYLGWFAGPIPFMAATALIILVLIRRQFWSNPIFPALAAMREAAAHGPGNSDDERPASR